MKEMVAFLWLFKDEPQLMTNDAAFRIIQALEYRGNDWGRFMSWKFRVPLFGWSIRKYVML